MAGIIKPTSGRVAAEGRIGSLLELGAGFHPDFTGRENVFLNGSIQGLPRRQIRERFDEIVAFAELEHAIDRPVRTYSSGMYMRLGFAIAALLDADMLLLDEVFAVGDEAFQRKCFGRIFEFKQRGGTIVFVSHDAASVERLCERAVLLQHGRGRLRRADPRGDHPVPARCSPTSSTRRSAAPGCGSGVRARPDRGGAAARPRRRAARAVPRRRGAHAVGRDRGRARRRGAALQLELRDDSGLLVASDVAETAALGWNGSGRLEATLTCPRCRSRSAASTCGSGSPMLPVSASPLARRGAGVRRLPRRRGAGLVRLGGAWRCRTRTRGRAMSYKTCPDWPELMEIAPELQFKHYHRCRRAAPVRGADEGLRRLARRGRDLLRYRAHVFYAAHTDPQITAALAGTHWYEVREWASTGPGTSHAA